MKQKQFFSFLGLTVALLLSSLDAVAGSTGVPRKTRLVRSEQVQGVYVVKLRENVDEARLNRIAAEMVAQYGGKLKYVYPYALGGFAVEALPKAKARAIARDARVEWVEQDTRSEYITVVGQPPEIADGVPKPLDRIDQRSSSLDHLYYYQRTGIGVHVYIVDTGVYMRHNTFGGRAYPVFDFAPPLPGNPSKFHEFGGRAYAESRDFNDFHGTAVAGIVGGKGPDYGVCKNCLLYSARCGITFLNNTTGEAGGTVNASDFARAVDAVIADVQQKNRRPAIINASVTFTLTSAATVEGAVNRALQAGIVFVTGAANDNGSASNRTPQRMQNIIVVGATSGADHAPDRKSSFSNTGSSVDLWAPGGDYNVLMPDGSRKHHRLRAPRASRTYETDGWAGTSFASPLAAGVAALYLEAHPNASPADVENAMRGNATFGTAAPGPVLYSGCQNTDFIPPPPINPIDDSRIFVRQHYFDFLGRTPDAGGENFWVGEIENCGANGACRHERRIGVSLAFFNSIEFQETGGYVYRLNRISFTSFRDDTSERFSPQPRMERFYFDQRKVGENFVHRQTPDSVLDNNKNNFATEWFNRQRFQEELGGLSDEAFVDRLYSNVGITDPAMRDAQVVALQNGTSSRPQVLRAVADSDAMRIRLHDEAFVLMCYYGYLRRNPDDAPDGDYGGFFHWLSEFTSGRKNEFAMIDAFISSIEYKDRFFRDPVCNTMDGGGAAPPPPQDDPIEWEPGPIKGGNW
jgi:subtilisin family serine protease